MAIENTLIHFNKQEDFEEKINEIPKTSITFIKDAGTIYTHGSFYGAGDFELSTSSSRPVQNKVVTEEVQRIWIGISGESFNKDFNRDFAVNPV